MIANGCRNQARFSRLPLPAHVDEAYPLGNVLMLVSTPSIQLAPSQLAEMTQQDPGLSCVKEKVRSSELRKLANEEFAAYRKLEAKSSIQEGCLIRGCRVTIPLKARKCIGPGPREPQRNCWNESLR